MATYTNWVDGNANRRAAFRRRCEIALEIAAGSRYGRTFTLARRTRYALSRLFGATRMSRLVGGACITTTAALCSFAALPTAANASAAEAPDAVAIIGDGRIPLTRRDDYVRRDFSDTASRIRIDGKLDEPAWHGLEVFEDFRLIDPDTLEPGALPTRVRMFYTGRGFYLGAEMVQDADTLVEHLTGRDQGYLNRDYFSISLDTSGEGRYGFWFQLNLGNSVSDGTLLPARNYSTSWDGAWRGATARTEDGWTAEFYIPWSVVNIPPQDGVRTIGLFAQRNVAHADERYAWPPLPWTQPKFMSEFQSLGLADVSPKQQYSVTPYISASYDRFRQGDIEPKAGVDLFWRPATGMQFAATLNPDFGNVEADDVVVNLSNYETFFPEKRLFFQEGQEVFTTSGRMQGGATMLHTRRMGAPAVRPEVPEGARLDAADLRRPAALLGAVKATGQAGSFRYGFLGVAEDDARFDAYDGDTHMVLGQDGRDFGALRMLYEHSNGGYKALGFMSTAMRHPTRTAAVNAMDGQYISTNGRLRASSQFIASDVDGSAEDGVGGFVDLSYSPRQGLSHYFSLDAFDDSIQLNDMGYMRRNDYREVRYRMRLSSPRFKRFRDTRTYVRVDRMWNTEGKVIGTRYGVDQRLVLNNLSQIRFSGELQPSHYDDRGSFGHGAFRVADTWEAELRYYSDSSRRFAYSVRQRWRAEETGEGIYQRTQGTFRWRPTDRMTMGLGINYVDRENWLLHQSKGAFTAFQADQLMPNFDLSYFFTARQQLRMAFQWVAIKAEEQSFYRLGEKQGELVPVAKDALAAPDDFAISRMNLQVRYRWELAPLSDLFVVYTNNAGMPFAETAGKDFVDLLTDTFDNTTGENLVLKFRYRFGS